MAAVTICSDFGDQKIKSATVSLEGETWNSPGQNTRVGNLSLLQGIFPTQGSNPGIPHCRWILYQLRHKGNPLGVLRVF